MAILPLVLSGCLPLLVGRATVLPPGELALSFAGMGRTRRLPAGVEQVGPAAGYVELRGGVPGGMGRVESGFTVEMPWHAGWDLKVQFLREGAWNPAAAVRADLGVFQPSFGFDLVASKTAGKLTLTALGGRGRRNERLWLTGAAPYSSQSENIIKDTYEWGVGVDWALGPIHDLFAGVVSWSSVNEHEAPRGVEAFHADEGPTFFFSTGLRIHWTLPRQPSPAAAVTALRGYVLSDPVGDRLEVGQPGVYRAVVLLDVYTRVLSNGQPAPRTELKLGRALLVQGIALPQPSTFLARTIELQ